MASSSGLRPSTEDDDMLFVLESRLKDMREAVDTQGAALLADSDSPDPSEGARAIAELRRSLDGIKSSTRPSKLQERFSAAVSASSSPVVRLSAPKEAIPPEPRTGLSTPTPPVVSQYTDSAIAATVNRAAGLQPGEITASKIALVNRNAASRSLVLDSMRTTETLGSMIQRAVSPRTGPRTQPAPPAVVHSMPKPPSNLPVRALLHQFVYLQGIDVLL